MNILCIVNNLCIVGAKMCRDLLWILPLAILLCPTCLHASNGDPKGMLNELKSSVYHSPPFFLRPGSVVNKFYFGIPFPNGHIALKSFDAEVVDEMGVPVTLLEAYLHHWVLERYYGPKEDLFANQAMNAGDVDLSKIIVARNSGICKNTLGQYFGLGSETRKTSTWVPGAYGIEVGNPEEVPDGYEERWLLNVHAIDTRGVEDRLGCTECKCSLYNVTEDEHGNPMRKNYNGGLECCYDQTQCRTIQGFQGSERKLYLQYRVTWVHWDASVLPVKIYIFDVTDTGTTLSNDTIIKGNAPSSCKVEYDVKACGIEGKSNAECIDTKNTRVVLPHGGDIVYGVAHQHSGGAGSALYGQDGRLLCSSMPYYGKGKEVGDEAGYIVGMSTCYPMPGSIKVADGEHLTLVSNYSSSRQHTGVMGLFYILVAEEQQHEPTLHHTLPVTSWTMKGNTLSNYTWAFIFTGGIVAVVIGVLRSKRYNGEGGYETLAIA